MRTKVIAIYGLLSIFSLSVIFHLLVIIGFIPYDIVWGGRLSDFTEMVIFESISIILNLLMLTVVASYAGYLKKGINHKAIKVALWLMFFLFLVNTIGNLNSNNEMERILFTPITILVAAFSLRLALSRGGA